MYTLYFPACGAKADLARRRVRISSTRIVAGRIQLVDIQRGPFIKRDTGVAMVTGFPFRAYILAIDGFCEYPCAGGLSNPSRTAKKECMRQLMVPDGVFQGSRDMRLTHNRRKILGPVFSGRNDEFVHWFCSQGKPTTSPSFFPSPATKQPSPRGYRLKPISSLSSQFFRASFSVSIVFAPWPSRFYHQKTKKDRLFRVGLLNFVQF